MGTVSQNSPTVYEREDAKDVAQQTHLQKELDAGALFVLKSKGNIFNPNKYNNMYITIS